MELQGDISVMFSPETLAQYVLEELKAQCDWMDYSLYHLDGTEQIRHLDCLLAMDELQAIQWTHVYGQPSPVQFLPVLQRIQAAGKKLVITLDDYSRLTDLEIARTVIKRPLIVANAASREEAERAVEMAEKLTHE